MRIAKDDSCPHFEKTVDEEEARFKKFFVNQNSAFALGGGDESDGGHVGRETGPRGIGNVGDSSAKLFFDFECLIFSDENILAFNFGKPGQGASAMWGTAPPNSFSTSSV